MAATYAKPVLVRKDAGSHCSDCGKFESGLPSGSTCSKCTEPTCPYCKTRKCEAGKGKCSSCKPPVARSMRRIATDE